MDPDNSMTELSSETVALSVSDEIFCHSIARNVQHKTYMRIVLHFADCDELDVVLPAISRRNKGSISWSRVIDCRNQRGGVMMQAMSCLIFGKCRRQNNIPQQHAPLKNVMDCMVRTPYSY